MFNKRPMRTLKTYLEITTKLVSNSTEKEDSLEECILHTALLNALIEKIKLTRNDINGNMLNHLADKDIN